MDSLYACRERYTLLGRTGTRGIYPHSRCSYTTGLAPSVLGYILQMLVGNRFGGKVTWDELGLPCTESGMALPCGATGRWMSE